MQLTKNNLAPYSQALVQAMQAAAESNRFYGTVEILAVRTHAEACHDLLQLRQAVWDGVLPICTADSITSIYGCRGNFHFRVWHDLGHLHYGLDMTHDDELKLHVLLWAEILPRIPDDLRWRCNLLYQADTAGQSWFHKLTGEFPADQTAFCLAIANSLSSGSINVKDAVLRYVGAGK